MESEIWKQTEFIDYEVSNFGRVRSNKRTVKEKVLIHQFDKRGYPQVCLTVNGKPITRRIHVLVWDAFGDKPRDGRNINIDHKDFNKSNNWISNLQALTSRENTIKSRKKSGKLIGAWPKRNKWQSRICINGKYKTLGCSFKTELEAHQAYMKAKAELL